MGFDYASRLSELLPEPPSNFPTGEGIKVLRGRTLTKFGDWHKAILLIEIDGVKKLRLYGWQKRNGKYKVRQKFNISVGYAEIIMMVTGTFISEFGRPDLGYLEEEDDN